MGPPISSFAVRELIICIIRRLALSFLLNEDPSISEFRSNTLLMTSNILYVLRPGFVMYSETYATTALIAVPESRLVISVLHLNK